MIIKKLMRMFLIGAVLAAILGAGILVGCTGDSREGQESGATEGQDVSERGGESGGEGGGTGSEAGEAAMSSPTVPLGQTWEGMLGGLAVFARYDAATNSVQSIVRNTTSQVLCYVQTEPHLKSGTRNGRGAWARCAGASGPRTASDIQRVGRQ